MPYMCLRTQEPRLIWPPGKRPEHHQRCADDHRLSPCLSCKATNLFSGTEVRLFVEGRGCGGFLVMSRERSFTHTTRTHTHTHTNESGHTHDTFGIS